ncbi:hypothetical protein [Leptolyngbya sp. FACHB-261]|uniref:hypothetical protein n=1 Tax=Leptolyngbya sp. FACHB-261 TaxID=2692806 RepID=UPI0018F03B11|nr:hypothetical protein [Leptolyngbya sp. FACHB-261]
MNFTVELVQESDGRWLAEVAEMPDVLAYGQSQGQATTRVQALALRKVAEQLEDTESELQLLTIAFVKPVKQPIWEIFDQIMAGMPEEELSQLPADASIQHDHYLYGLPVREA